MLPTDAKKNMGEKMYAQFLRVLDGSIMLRRPTPEAPWSRFRVRWNAALLNALCHQCMGIVAI